MLVDAEPKESPIDIPSFCLHVYHIIKTEFNRHYGKFNKVHKNSFRNARARRKTIVQNISTKIYLVISFYSVFFSLFVLPTTVVEVFLLLLLIMSGFILLIIFCTSNKIFMHLHICLSHLT